MTRPRSLFLLCAAAALAIWVNALWLQPGKHPAPLFAQHAGTGGPPADMGRDGKGDLLVKAATPRVPERKDVISDLQAGLKILGFYDGPVDGIDGPRTQMAVRLYRVAHGLVEADAPLDRLLGHVRMTSANLSPVPPPPPLASSEHRIRAIQRVLIRLGYDPGGVDGQIGALTIRAIERFERDHGLPVTGRITEALLRELTAASGVRLDEAFAG